MNLETAVQLVGYSTLAWIVYRVILPLIFSIHAYLLATPRDLKKLAGAKWAVVTGSTDGIGQAYALELARQGFDIVLVSRTQSKLDTTAAEIRRKHGVKVESVAFDFKAGELDVYERGLLSKLRKYEIGVLIPRLLVAFSLLKLLKVGLDYPERFERYEDPAAVTDCIRVNLMAVTLLSRFALEQMVPRNRGIVVNISSSAAFHTLPYWAAYSSSKAYMNRLTTILQKEYATATNIEIQLVCPLFVTTKMSKLKKSSIFVPNTTTFARAAVRSIGLLSTTTGCLSHEIQRFLAFDLLPPWLLDFFVRRHASSMRHLVMKKREQKKQ